MTLIVYTALVLVAIGALAAAVLYYTSQKFKVYEDPRIDQVAEALPGANCGGCGFAGCKALAEAYVKSEEGQEPFCPVGGDETMARVAEIMGRAAIKQTPMVAVVRCDGTPEARPRTNKYDSIESCAFQSMTYAGETGCQYGCVGCGDCTTVCSFGAISINPETKLAQVDPDLCTGCGSCVKACPKSVIELRKKAFKNRKVYVSCVNKDKGALCRKYCKNACIGCGKCAKVCPFNAITVVDNLAYIDHNLCRMCRKCVAECPTGAIHEVNFPPMRKVEESSAEKTVITKNSEICQ